MLIAPFAALAKTTVADVATTAIDDAECRKEMKIGGEEITHPTKLFQYRRCLNHKRVLRLKAEELAAQEQIRNDFKAQGVARAEKMRTDLEKQYFRNIKSKQTIRQQSRAKLPDLTSKKVIAGTRSRVRAEQQSLEDSLSKEFMAKKQQMKSTACAAVKTPKERQQCSINQIRIKQGLPPIETATSADTATGTGSIMDSGTGATMQ